MHLWTIRWQQAYMDGVDALDQAADCREETKRKAPMTVQDGAVTWFVP
jgi:hypothetical protein